MKVGAKVFALALLTFISAWWLSSYSKKATGTLTNADASDDVADKVNAHAKHGEAKTISHQPEEHGRHAHKTDRHRKHEHKHHKHGGNRANESPPEAIVKIDEKVPDFAIQMLDGKSVKLSELQKDEKQTKTGVVVLSFWCTTCHSCRDVEHLLAKLYKDYQGHAAVFALGANADETAETAEAFVKENGLELPIVLDSGRNTANLFGVNKTTTTVVIDGNRVLRYCGQFRQKGGGSAEAALKAILAGKEVAVKTTPHFG